MEKINEFKDLFLVRKKLRYDDTVKIFNDLIVTVKQAKVGKIQNFEDKILVYYLDEESKKYFLEEYKNNTDQTPKKTEGLSPKQFYEYLNINRYLLNENIVNYTNHKYNYQTKHSYAQTEWDNSFSRIYIYDILPKERMSKDYWGKDVSEKNVYIVYNLKTFAKNYIPDTAILNSTNIQIRDLGETEKVKINGDIWSIGYKNGSEIIEFLNTLDKQTNLSVLNFKNTQYGSVYADINGVNVRISNHIAWSPNHPPYDVDINIEKVGLSVNIKKLFEEIKGKRTYVGDSQLIVKMKLGGMINGGVKHSSLGFAKELSISPIIKEHDMIAECGDCGEKFSYQNSKNHILWECSECKSIKRIS